MGELTDIIAKYQPYIDEVFGNLSDIRAKTNYQEARRELESMQEEKDKVTRFRSLLQKLKTTEIPENEMYDLSPDAKKYSGIMNQHTDKPIVQNLVQGMKYYDKEGKEIPDIVKTGVGNNGGALVYSRAGKDAEGNSILLDDAEALKQALEQQNYISGFNNMDEATNFSTNYSKAFDPNERVPLSQDRQQALLFAKAGFTPQDMQLYNQYKDKLDSEKSYNQKLLDLLYHRSPDLISEGRLGTELSDNFRELVASHGIQEPNYKVQFDYDEGAMIVYNEDDPTDFHKIPYKDKKKKDAKPPDKPDYDKVEVDGNGNPYFYADVWDEATQSFIQKPLRNLSPKEKEKLDLMNQKDTKTGVYAPKKRGSVSPKGGVAKKINVDNLTKAEVQALTPEKLQSMSLSQLKKMYSEFYDVLSPEQRSAIEQTIQGGDGGTQNQEQYDGTGNIPDEAYLDEDNTMDEGLDEKALKRAQTQKEDVEWLNGEKDKIAQVLTEYAVDFENAVAEAGIDGRQEAQNRIEAIGQAMYKWVEQNLYLRDEKGQLLFPQELIDEAYQTVNNLKADAYSKIEHIK